MNTNRFLIVVILLITLSLPESASARSEGLSNLLVVPVSSDWTGTTSRGFPTSFSVASNGTQWNTFKLKTDWVSANCGASGTLELTIHGPGSIANSQFSVSSTNFSATGQFTSSTNATGTYSFTNYVITIPTPTGTCTYLFSQSGTWTASTSGGPIQLSFKSVGVRDGWIVESGENSNVGGAMNAANATFFLGDDASNKQYRAILHFNTASLPDNAVITKVLLKIKKQILVGTNPFTTHMKIAVDIRKGAFGNIVALQLIDFRAIASKPTVGFITNNPQTGDWYVANLNSTAYPFINLAGYTQFRLRFQLDDNNDLGADYLKFYSGDAATASRPTLVVTYQLP